MYVVKDSLLMVGNGRPIPSKSSRLSSLYFGVIPKYA